MRRIALALALAGAALVTGCDRDAQAGASGPLQTRMPGDITSGGRTSGEVMAANTPGGAVEPGPAGTPGIPRGSGGNTGGTAMGGTTPASPPATAASAPASAAAAPGLSDAQKQQQELVQVMDAVAARWRARAAAQDWPTHAPTEVAAVAGVQASATPASAATSATQPPIRSEKLGTAPPSPDVKQPTKAPTDTHVDRSAPAAAGPKPHL